MLRFRPPPTSCGPARRIVGLDVLRGLAVLLMVVDHFLLVTGGLPVVRHTLTRASLPLFALVAGSLVRSPRLSRVAAVAAAAAAATVVGAPLGIGQPDILWLLIGAVVLVGSTPGSWRPVVLAVAVIQPVTWPALWSGYQPGTVVALVLAGAWAGPEMAKRVPSWPWLAAVGRYPLSWYVGHLAVLAAAVS